MKKIRKFEGAVDVHDAQEMPRDQLLALLSFAALRAYENEDYAVSIVNGAAQCDCGNPHCENIRPTLLFCYHRTDAETQEIVDCAFAGVEVIWTPAAECDIAPLQLALGIVRGMHKEPNEGLGDGVMAMGVKAIPKGIELLKAHAIEGVA